MCKEKGKMPEYKCHKHVWALKIKDVMFDIDIAKEEGRETDGTANLVFEKNEYSPIKVDPAYLRKHASTANLIGGYYVVYADGYKSWSPAKAFEKGYTEIKGKKPAAPEIDRE